MAPSSPLEMEVHGIWQQLLKLSEPISVHENWVQVWFVGPVPPDFLNCALPPS